jgi:tight adherence protein B
MSWPAQNFISVMLFAGSLLFVYRVVARIRESEERDVDRLKLRNFPVRSSQTNSGLDNFNDWFVRLCYFIGDGINPTTAVLGIGLLAMVLGGLVSFGTGDAFLAVMVAFATVAILLVTMMLIRRQAIKQFEEQFPATLDLFSRAIRAGESVDQAMHLLARAKIGDVSQLEFRRCAGQLDMGLSLPAALNSMCDRIDLTDLRIFSSAMVAHRDGGGNLAMILDRLASVIRDRNNYRQQLKAVTGASRISVLLIAGLGPILFGWLFLVHPEYGAGLWEDPTGRMMLAYAIVSEVIGLAIVGTMLKAEY